MLIRVFILFIIFATSVAHAYEYSAFIKKYYEEHVKIKAHNKIVMLDLQKHNKKNKALQLKDFLKINNDWKRSFKEGIYKKFVDLVIKKSSTIASRVQYKAGGLIYNVSFIGVQGLTVSSSDFTENIWFPQIYDKQKLFTDKNYSYIGDIVYNKDSRVFTLDAIFPLFQENTFIGTIFMQFNAEELAVVQSSKGGNL